METDLERLQREVFSVDTEAGYKLRYHITRALACPDYAKEIGFVLRSAKRGLSSLFIWQNTSEGTLYWANIFHLLDAEKRHHDSGR